MKNYLYYLLSIIFLNYFEMATAQQVIKISLNTCAFSDCPSLMSELKIYPASQKTNTIINEIMAKIGLRPNFTLHVSPTVKNALATVILGEKCIIYNEIWMNKIDLASKDNWASIFILAHEIGHHLSTHKVDAVDNSSPQSELEADMFAGFIMYKLGATLSETQNALSSVSELGCITHPPRKVRIDTATAGWTNAKNDDDKKNEAITNKINDLEKNVNDLKNAKDDNRLADLANKECVQKNTGNYCFTNNDDAIVSVTLYDGSIGYHKLTIQPKQTECVYDIYSMAYQYFLFFENSANNLPQTKYGGAGPYQYTGQIKVERCKSGSYTIK
jgi:hypothetical protein